MKIENFSVIMSSSHDSLISHTMEESLKLWAGGRRPDFDGQDPNRPSSGLHSLTVELSDRAGALPPQEMAPREVKPADDTAVFKISNEDRFKILLIERMMEFLTGKKFKFYLVEKMELREGAVEIVNLREPVSGAEQRQGWGLEYHYRETYYEQEKLSFAARGVVTTADGREIGFSLKLKMSREYSVQNEIRVRAGNAAVDPLVISFDGTPPGLTEAKFSFDLDADGKEDLISFVRPGSGFLVLDLNGDGCVNDGRELFGPRTGDGFAELARYDQDGNLWIDENDAVYHRLRIWTRGPDGSDVLETLSQRGVGAIYLGSSIAAFDLKDSTHNLLGKMIKAGIYLREDGSAGTIQQIDLVV